METQFWIEKGWGDPKDNITMQDVRVAIYETINMDDEHGAFWVGHYENGKALEIQKDLKISYTYDPDSYDSTNAKLNTWKEVEYLYELFLDNQYDQIKNFIEAKKNSDFI